MPPVTSWDDYRFFLALCRKGSTARAARDLRVDPTTVRRRLAAMEDALGARLVHRRSDRLALTEMGERLLARARALEDTMAAIEREVGAADEKLAGTIRFTAGEAFVSLVVAPALPAFRARHPAISVELVADNQRLDLTRHEADLALRLVLPTDDSLVARKIATLEFGVYAATAYLDRAGRPRAEKDLARHEWVGFDTSLERTPETRWLLERDVTFAIRANSPVAVYAATAAGGGLAAIATFFVKKYPQLERVLPDAALPSREVWLVTHRDLARSAKVRALSEFVRGLIQSNHAASG
jgi:DNA-binding transcriptional LysR family regulator